MPLPDINAPVQVTRREGPRSAAQQEAIEQELAATFDAVGIAPGAALEGALKPELVCPTPKLSMAVKDSTSSSSTPVPSSLSRPAPEMAPSCDVGGQGPFTLTVNIIRRGGTKQIRTIVSPQDIVAAVIADIEPNFFADLRFHGEFDNLPKDLSLLDVGVSSAMEVDLQVSCMMRGGPKLQSLPN